MEGTIICHDVMEESWTGFFIQGMEAWLAIVGLNVGIDVDVGSNAMHVLLLSEGADEDDIEGTVQGYHDILVATPCTRFEPSCVIYEDACQGDSDDVQVAVFGAYR